MRYNRLIILLLQKTLKPDFNLGLNRSMSAEFFLVPAFRKNIILVVILLHQRIRVCRRNGIHRVHYLIYRICVNLPAELDLRFHLVTVCHSHISHIIGHAHYADMGRFHHAHCRAHP